MLSFLTNLGLPELVVILVIAVLIFGKDLPQAASKAYLQARKLRNAVDDLRRDSGIERELRDIERNVREAEWEARKPRSASPPPPVGSKDRPYVRPIPSEIPPTGSSEHPNVLPEATAEAVPALEDPPAAELPATGAPPAEPVEPEPPTGAAS